MDVGNRKGFPLWAVALLRKCHGFEATPSSDMFFQVDRLSAATRFRELKQCLSAPRRSVQATGQRAEVELALESASDRLRPGPVLLRHLGPGHGSGFAFSRRRRLAGTAALVADYAFEARRKSMQVSPEGTSVVYRVFHVWYHSLIMRWLDDALYARSAYPGDREFPNRVPDLAILELSMDVPELQLECAIAHDDEMAALGRAPRGRDRMRRSIWRHPTDGWLDLSGRAQGRLCRENYACLG